MPLDATSINNPHQTIFSDNSQWGRSSDWYWKGIRCHWRVLGENNQKPLVLVHGFGASSAHWRHNAQTFVDSGYKVYGLDLIGFGASEQPSPNKVQTLDNAFWGNQLKAFLEQVVQTKSKEKAVLVGNSLGSLTALSTVTCNSDLVAAVVAAPLPDPAFMKKISFYEPIWLINIRKLFTKIFFYLIPLEALVPIVSRTFLIRIALQGAYYRIISSDKELLRIVTRPAQRATAARALRAMCIGMSTRKKENTAPEMLDQLSREKNKPPILLIWGKEDKFVPIRIGKKIINLHPWIDLVVLNKTGHCPHDELPTEFNKTVLHWLETNLGVNQQEA